MSRCRDELCYRQIRFPGKLNEGIVTLDAFSGSRLTESVLA